MRRDVDHARVRDLVLVGCAAAASGGVSGEGAEEEAVVRR